MQITRELLETELKGLTLQYEQAKALAAQAAGAITMVKAFIAELDREEPAIPMQDFVEMVGGKGATAEILGDDKLDG